MKGEVAVSLIKIRIGALTILQSLQMKIFALSQMKIFALSRVPPLSRSVMELILLLTGYFFTWELLHTLKPC